MEKLLVQQDTQRGHLIDVPWRSRWILKLGLRPCATVLQIAWKHGQIFQGEEGLMDCFPPPWLRAAAAPAAPAVASPRKPHPVWPPLAFWAPEEDLTKGDFPGVAAASCTTGNNCPFGATLTD